jgi:hypothetical protein
MLDARDGMYRNADEFNRLIRPLCTVVDGVPSNDVGMFAYFQVRDGDRFRAALADSRVMMVTGQACGDPRPDYFRMNMMQDTDYTRNALVALRQEYDR